MLSLVATLLLSAPELPASCQPPAQRELTVLTQYVQAEGAFSVGLDSVATWCFDSGGEWTGGGAKASAKAAPSGDCKTAVASCESAREGVPASARKLLYDTLAELQRPYMGVTYQPKRSGLGERPSEAADCQSRDRQALFGAAQARMDLARLASVTQNEYGNYRTWLFAEGLKCAEAVAKNERDVTRRGVAVDSAVKGGGTQTVQSTVLVDGADRPQPTANGPKSITAAAGSTRVLPHETPGGASPSPTPAANGPKSITAAAGSGRVLPHETPGGASPSPTAAAKYVGGPTAERERALASSMIEKWSYFLAEQQKIEGDVDWVDGFLASRELRDCRCAPRPIPGDVVRRLQSGDRVAQLEADDAKNTRCELCLLDSFPKWKTRAVKQCALALDLTEFELGVLQRSDDGNGFPPRCVTAARAKLEGRVPGRVGTVTMGGAPQPVKKPVNGGFIILKVDEEKPVAPVVEEKPEPPPPKIVIEAIEPPATPKTPVVASGNTVRREAGRVYVRLSMSRTCMAEVLAPQAIAVHDGDVLPVPINAKELTVRGACGGIAELLYGTEDTPRVSEPFSSDKPVNFKFRE